ncbi:MAG: peptide-methionine (R)-S-oxide reductase MsrB [Flavobacteriales bacterium]|jgi:peptide-methionine (R)-S-oxide reductase|nr:peptide-methionine (R)-S-oxide reductase MsrB [Flavobacteriales bacterium]
MIRNTTLCLFIAIAFGACAQKQTSADNETASAAAGGQNTIEKIEKSDTEWKAILSPEVYHIMREQGTERAFTGPYVDNHEAGTYLCAACQLPLFDAATKFESGTGWPSFYAPINDQNVGEHTDSSYGMVRTEVVCNRCEGHLGHVFDDGPKPTGLRFCINGNALQFEHE